jgi:hypothetical protein
MTSHSKLLCEFDPVLGWRKKLGGKGTHITSEFQVFERFNSKGLREPEQTYDKDSSEYRVLFLGDSFTEGYSVATHHLFSRRLEVSLNETEANRFYRCINAGTGGYSTDQELLFFDLEGQKYRPDLTVLMFFQNDLLENASSRTFRGYEKPLFRLDSGELVLTNGPLSRPPQIGTPVVYQAFSKLIASSFILSSLEMSANIFSFRWNLWRTKLMTLLGRDRLPSTLGVWAAAGFPEVDAAWNLTNALIARLRDHVVAQGGRFMIFYVPHEIEVYPEIWEFTRRLWGIPEEGWSTRQIISRLEAFCATNNIMIIDPSEEFRKQAAISEGSKERLYYPIDGHWNPKGHALAASILEMTVRELASRDNRL